jgi:hypothetical protein
MKRTLDNCPHRQTAISQLRGRRFLGLFGKSLAAAASSFLATIAGPSGSAFADEVAVRVISMAGLDKFRRTISEVQEDRLLAVAGGVVFIEEKQWTPHLLLLLVSEVTSWRPRQRVRCHSRRSAA